MWSFLVLLLAFVAQHSVVVQAGRPQLLPNNANRGLSIAAPRGRRDSQPYYYRRDLLDLVRARYPRIDEDTLAQVVHLLLQCGPSRRLHRLARLPNTVPINRPVPSNFRRQYLQRCLPSLPSVFIDKFFTSGVIGALRTSTGNRRFPKEPLSLSTQLAGGRLVRLLRSNLVLIDSALAVNFVTPTSPDRFVKFFRDNHLLLSSGQLAPVDGEDLTQKQFQVDLERCVSRLLNTSASVITGAPGFKQLPNLPGFDLQPLDTSVLSPNEERRDFSTVVTPLDLDIQCLLGQLHLLGLPRPVRPYITVPAFLNYLRQIKIAVSGFLTLIRDERVPYQRYLIDIDLPAVQRHWGRLNKELVSRDLLVIVSLRYIGLPKQLRQRLPFAALFTDFSKHWQLKIADGNERFTKQLVQRVLTAFDAYVKSLLRGRYRPQGALFKQVTSLTDWDQLLKLPLSTTALGQGKCRALASPLCLWDNRFGLPLFKHDTNDW